MTDLIPAISEFDWDAFSKKISLVAPHTRWVHVFVSDGTMGTPETTTDFAKLPLLLRQHPAISVEAHVLSANPGKYLRPLADAGFKRIIAHVESNDPGRFLDEAKFDEVEVGLALDGATEVEQVEPFLEEVDFVVVMTAEAGVSGGTFLPEAVEKVKLIHEHYPDLPIEVVGGITPDTAKAVRDAGATRIVAGEYIFKDSERVVEAIQAFKQ